MPVVGVVVVTYRSAATIEACLRSLRSSSTPHEVRVVVLDNASHDNSVSLASAADPAATVIARAANDGYAVACNEGIAHLGDAVDWVLFANPDTLWPAGALEALVSIAEGAPRAGLVSPALVGLDDTAQPMIERDLTLSRVVRGMVRLGRAVRPAVPPLSGPPQSVEWLHTAAALMPAAVARQLGGFDPRFFLFAEDADLCRRVRTAGFDVLVAPEVHVTHIGGASVAESAAAGEADAAALRVRAVGTYLDKHEGALARRAFGALGALVYSVAGHRAQARAAWSEARR